MKFFIFSDGKPVSQPQMREVLRYAISSLGLDHTLYGVHSLRIGKASDLAKFSYTLDEIHHLGRWQSNAVFKYIRD